jgi:hypothetical protein
MLPIKVMRIGNNWSSDTPRLHCERPRPSGFIFEPRKLLNFDFIENLDQAFHSNPDPDPNPASRNNADPDPQPWLKVTGSVTYALLLILTVAFNAEL